MNGDFLQLPDGVDQVFQTGVMPPRLDAPDGDENQDEDDIHHGDRGLEKIVVVGGDELHDLVDKIPEAYAADDGRQALSPLAQKDEEDQDGNEHEEPSPEHVGDMKPFPAQFGITCQFEEGPDDQNGGDGRDQESLQVAARVEIADEQPLVLHGSSLLPEGFSGRGFPDFFTILKISMAASTEKARPRRMAHSLTETGEVRRAACIKGTCMARR